MARQNTSPLALPRSTRNDEAMIATSGRAGVVTLVDYFPVLRGDAVGGALVYDVVLNHMPKPVRNSVICNMQAWFVPHSSLPRFQSYSEFLHSAREAEIRYADGVGAEATRTAAPFFQYHTGAAATAIRGSEHYQTLGLHMPVAWGLNDHLLDCYSQIWNFRALAHSSRLDLRQPFVADNAAACAFGRAFWPQNRYSRVVPDYEQALVLGQVSLDVLAGQLNVSGIHNLSTAGAPSDHWVSSASPSNRSMALTNPAALNHMDLLVTDSGTGNRNAIAFDQVSDARTAAFDIYAEMAGSRVDVSLADMDMARKTQAWGRYRASLQGNRTNGYANDDMLMAELMSGISVPWDEYDRPVLLGSELTRFAMLERSAMDGPSLDQSTSRGRVTGRIPCNVPQQDVGGLVLITCEVLPERIYERQSDVYLRKSGPTGLPDALRDSRVIEPVSTVTQRHLDAASTSDSVYGYRPLNDEWRRSYTRLGGAFYQPTPGAGFSEARSAFWLPEIIDPIYSDDHFLAPAPFPHDVFADTEGPAFEITINRQCAIRGLTVFGEDLIEDNGDFAAVAAV